MQDNAHCTVETIDLIRAIEKATGRNLRFLFDQYVFRGGHPDYSITYSWDSDSNLAKLSVTQTQAQDGDTSSSSGLFDLKLPIAFGSVQADKAELKTFTVRLHDRTQTFYFPLEAKPQFVSFDAGNHTLKTVTLEYPMAELKAQLQFDPDPLSRIVAAEAIAKKGGLEAVNALTETLHSEKFWGVRAEIAENLAKIRLDQAFASLKQGLKDPHPKVRRAVAAALGGIKTQESYRALKALVESGDASYYVEAAAAKSIGNVGASSLNGKTKDKKVVKLLETVLKERAGWNEVVRSGAVAGLSQLKTSEEALEIILKYTEAGTPQALRLGAIRALGTISTGQSKQNLEQILERLESLSREEFFLTQMAVIGALGQMETANAIGVLQALAEQTPDGRVRRRAEEAVEKVRKAIDSNQAVQTLQQEVDELKKANQELKSRLEALEAKTKL